MSAVLAACSAPPAGLAEVSESEPAASDEASPDPVEEPAVAGPTPSERSVETATPVGHRVVRSGALVYAAPNRRGGRRGRTEPRRPFAIFGVEPGPGCEGEGWARVEQGGFVCLEHAGTSKGPAQIQPELAAEQMLPFIYARPKILDRKTGAIARVPRYLDRYALVRNDPPIDWLEPDRQYTFLRTKTRRAGLMLIDADERATPARDMKIAAPSLFAGRELAREPVASGLRPAWAVGHPAVLRDAPATNAKQVGTVEYHASLAVDPTPIVVGEESWYAVPDGAGPGNDAYVVAADMNYWIPGPTLAEARADEVWIDVELGQQTLAVMRGQSPEFVTLISSGAGGTGTPPGLFRIYEKLAVATMRSGPNAEDPYFVEGVPWVQYFHRRYALHASYWHDDFGKRRSHGCINLSPKDAARVYAATSPNVPPGWNSLLEHAGDPGTLVRVRRGTDPVEDRRLPLGVIEPGQEGEETAEPAPAE
ncbi:L,D-transpeptidase [Nannocystis bainbridge]|uniref:L,D-transpeptidase n=1 Tax=Nannocystis bainbridge TaxID=2995303 RepID=A0ABT5DX31_9BACT|nr:L,D-transpeptidase [Nannocystis bainbridge]MDC0718110.1 L,D-transpeptidase [Nannocystis bainbridge]